LRFMKLIAKIRHSYSLALILVLTTIAACCFSTISVSAKPLSLYVSGGISDPSGELASGVQVGYYGASRIGLRIDPRTEVLAGMDYHSFNLDKLQLAGVTGRFWTLMVGFDMKMDLGIPREPINPFLIFGGGYAKIDFSDTLTQIIGSSTFKADSDSKTYVEFGGGFELSQLFAVVRFVNIFTEQADGRFFSAGLGFKLPLI